MTTQAMMIKTATIKAMLSKASALLAVWLLGASWLVMPVLAQEGPLLAQEEEASDRGGQIEQSDRGGQGERGNYGRGGFGRGESGRGDYGRGPGAMRFGPPGYWADEFAGNEDEEREGDAVECAEGFVFVDGKYVSPPYFVRGAEDGIYINDLKVHAYVTGSQQQSRRGRQMRDDQYANSARYLADVLEQDFVVVSLPGQPVSVIADMGARCDLFRELTHAPGKTVTGVSLVSHFSGDVDKGVVDQWVRGYEATPEFQARAGGAIKFYEDSEAAAVAEVSATHRLNQFSYPLTVFGMIMTVLATGHLLSHRPPSTKTPNQTDSSPETMKVVVWSLALVALLSALDLAWTILASQAGQMRELNPFGAQLIQDPAKLFFFKFAVIGGAIGLLYALRRYPHAQAGAWWAVLICTLLTVRWLTFNSLFMA